MAKLAAKVINNYVNGLFMKKVIRERGWSKQDAVYAVSAYLTCGKNISIAEFLSNYEPGKVLTH